MRTFESEWRLRFERFGARYTEEHKISGWSVDGLRRRLHLFQRYFAGLDLADDARVLEVGCGGGTYVRYLARLGLATVGIDYALPSLARAVAADPGSKGRYVGADAYALPFQAASFDMVVCIGVLQSLSAPKRLIAEVTRVLRPRGVLLIETLSPTELPALGGALIRRLTGRSPRLHRHPVRLVTAWLDMEGVEPEQTLPVYVPPRRWPWLGRLIDHPLVTCALNDVPGAAAMTAHAFWVVGRKRR